MKKKSAAFVKYCFPKKPQGNYYEDWKVEMTQAGVMPVGVFDLLFIGKKVTIIFPHFGIDCITNHSLKFFLRNPLGKSGAVIALLVVKVRRLKTVFLSKNDYKDLGKKKRVFSKVSRSTVVTHTKEAETDFSQIGLVTVWCPFGWSPERIRSIPREKKICIGFRGNANSKWLSRDRETFHCFENYRHGLPNDIRLSVNGEHFLYGREYYVWLSQCLFHLNGPSARGTVSPRFFEQMALGVCPIAFVDEYEGLLSPLLNYIPIDEQDPTRSFELLRNDELVSKIVRNNLLLSDKFRIGSMLGELL